VIIVPDAVCDVVGTAVAGGDVAVLVGFRQGLYDCVTARVDALFELVDALVCRPGRGESLPGLSLEPEFRRGHGSVYAALTAGRVEVDRLRELVLGTVPAGRNGLVWFAGDVSGWPRPEARCSPERVVMHDKSARTLAGDPVTSGWPFLVLAGLEWGPTSWTAPVDAVRQGPTDTLTGLTLAAMRRVLAGLAAAGRTETVGYVFDAEFDLMAFSHELAGQAHVVGRLRANQVFHADPTPAELTPGRGRPRRHGVKIQLNKPATLGTPDRVAETVSPRYGQVRLSAWDQRHRRLQRRGHWADHPGELPIVAGTVIRVEIERVGPGGTRPDGPMWLWHAGPTPLDLVTVFAAYQRRFDLEHTFRYLKQDLMWILPAPMLPGTADTWTWLVLAAYTQLRLARTLCRDLRLSWEKPAAPDRIPPRRVRRDFRRLRALTGTPANAPKTTRPGPGRPPGSTRPPHDRHPTHNKNTQRHKKTKQPTTKTKPPG
jgi:hypothetical protein